MTLVSRLVALFVLLLSVNNVAGWSFPAQKDRRNKSSIPSRVKSTSSNTALSFSASHTPASLILGAALLVLPVAPGHAADTSVFTNDYGDPLHPLCERHIKVNADGKTFSYAGTAVGPKNDPILRGCSPKEIKEFGLRQGAFEGEILSNKRISAGDGIHEGVWEPAFSAKTKLGYENADGIRWNDGNKWFVLSKE